MINYIKGTIVQIEESYIVVDNNGIGYLIFVPSSVLFNYTIGMKTTIYTYMSVKEDDVSLFGFADRDDLKLFKNLISVSGIGPKGAIAILSSMQANELKMAIAAGDYKLIAKSKGIGLKTAEKLVVELKGKYEKETVNLGLNNVSGSPNNNCETAIAFAVSTGINRTQCLKAISKAGDITGLSVDEIIDIIFKNLSI